VVLGVLLVPFASSNPGSSPYISALSGLVASAAYAQTACNMKRCNFDGPGLPTCNAVPFAQHCQLGHGQDCTTLTCDI
jgi:hypothetical protein